MWCGMGFSDEDFEKASKVNSNSQLYKQAGNSIVVNVLEEIFKMLLSVSGIGASIARTMLSSLEPKQIIQAIASGDVGTVQSIKGIGVKTAQRVILDLQDKVLKLYDLDEISMVLNNTNRDEALSALEVLGFVRKSSEKVVEKIIKEDPDATVESIIKRALKSL